MINESIAAVEKKVLKGTFGNDETHDVLYAMANFLEDHLADCVLISYAINEKVVLNSRQVIEILHINASDALHVLIAYSSECDYFISTDKELNERINNADMRMRALDLNDSIAVNLFIKAVESYY